MPFQLSAIFLNRERKLRNGWWMAVFMAGLALLLFPALLIGPRMGHDLTMADQAVIILAATWACQVLRRRPLTEVTGRLNLRWLKELGLGGVIGAVLMLVPALFLLAGGWVSLQPGSIDLTAVGTGLLLMAGVAVAEELLFRGVLFQRLIDGLGAWPAQLLIAGLFMLTHMGNPGMEGTTRFLAGANIFLASMLFGLVFLRTRSLAMPIGLHFMANVTQGVVLGFGVSGATGTGILTPRFNNAATWLTGGDFGLEASAPGLVCVVIAIVVVAAYGVRRQAGLRLQGATAGGRVAPLGHQERQGKPGADD